MKIRKAVIPVAGLGTRFLQATKAIPKEMLTIVDRPTIQYIVEEVVASGVNEVILVTSEGKSAIENHFDYNYELESVLIEKRKKELCVELANISNLIDVVSVRQKKPLGLGHAICSEEDEEGAGQRQQLMDHGTKARLLEGIGRDADQRRQKRERSKE